MAIQRKSIHFIQKKFKQIQIPCRKNCRTDIEVKGIEKRDTENRKNKLQVLHISPYGSKNARGCVTQCFKHSEHAKTHNLIVLYFHLLTNGEKKSKEICKFG